MYMLSLHFYIFGFTQILLVGWPAWVRVVPFYRALFFFFTGETRQEQEQKQ